MSLIANERIKLTAGWLNTLSATTIATGVVAPLVAIVFGFPTSASVSVAGFALVCGAWLFLRCRPTFCSATRSSKIAAMTWFELYALFGSPLLLLLLVLAVVWLTGLQDNKKELPRTPAE